MAYIVSVWSDLVRASWFNSLIHYSSRVWRARKNQYCLSCTLSTYIKFIIQSHDLSPHLYADDTQVYVSCWPAAVSVLSSAISECTADVASWMRSNRLQLNYDKTEVLWCTTGRRQHQLPTAAFLIDEDFVCPTSSVRDMGIGADTVLKVGA